MTLTALAFAAGAALLQQQGQLPWLAWLAFLPLCIGLAALRWRGAAVFALVGGLLWAAACAPSWFGSRGPAGRCAPASRACSALPPQRASWLLSPSATSAPSPARNGGSSTAPESRT